MRRIKCFAVMLAIGLLAVVPAMAEEAVICPPVDEAVGETGVVGLGEAAVGETGVVELGEPAVGETNKGEKPSADDEGFVIEDGELKRYTGLSSDVIIPNTVTRLSNSVFEGDKRLRSIFVPDSVTVIGARAFYGCENLTEVAIADSVTKIGSNAFGFCRGLKHVRLPVGLESIESRLFWYCSRLDDMTVPGSVASIGDEAFSKCSSMVEINIEEGVTAIGNAFSGCVSLECARVPASVTKIDKKAFAECSELVILGPADSAVEAYAHASGIPFNEPIVMFEEKAIWLHMSQRRTLKAIQKPASRATDLVWSTSNAGIATVDVGGTVRAVSPGSAVITATPTDGQGVAAQITVNVPEASNIVLSCGVEQTVVLGEPFVVSAKVFTPFAAMMSQPFSVTWKSSNTTVVAVEGLPRTGAELPKAVIRGLALGTVTLTANTPDRGKASTVITVVPPAPDSITIDQEGPIQLSAGQQYRLKATMTPKEAVSNLDWYTVDENIASVSQEGVVTARAVGTTTIWVETYNDFEDRITIIVSPKVPASVKLNKSDTVTLALGKTLQLKATVEPVNTVTELTWRSSKTKVAVVSGDGKVTPVKTGTTTITVKTANGKKASVKVNVVAPQPKSVKITNGKRAKMTVGDKLALNAKLNPIYAESSLNWVSSDARIAEVSGKGVVTAKSVGSTTIIVFTGNKKKAAIEIVVREAVQ